MKNAIITGLALAVAVSIFFGTSALRADDPPVQIVHLQSNEGGGRGFTCPTQDFLLNFGGEIYTCTFVGQTIDGMCEYSCTIQG